MADTAASVRISPVLTSVLAAAAGAVWVLGITLVATQADTDPVGAGYDDANRVVTLASLLLFLSAVAARRGRRSRPGTTAVVGTALMLAGSALEFVVLPLLGGRPDALADREGTARSALSSIGFGVFAVGTLVLLVACVWLAVSLRSRGAADRVVIALTGPAVIAGTALWAVGPALAAVAASVAAACWWRAVTVGLGAADAD